jgi:hypothetical protein
MGYQAFTYFTLEKMKEFFKKNNIEKFKIKDWELERGEKYHPFLKNAPVTNIGTFLKETIEPFMPKLLDIIENKDKKYNEIINIKRDDNILSTSFRLNEIDKDFTKKIESAIAEKLGDGLIPANNAEININKMGFESLGPTGLGTTAWHTDAGTLNNDIRRSPHILQIITYLVDVNDNDDGPFEACLEPEKNFYDNETLSTFQIHVGEELHDKNMFPNKEDIGIKMLGPKYTTVMFVPYFPHRANYPIRKDRVVLAITFFLDPSKNFVDLKKYNLE